MTRAVPDDQPDEPARHDDPWGFGNSLEWATTSPPPRHNFHELPRIRSERPAFELHYPHMIERMRAESHVSITKPGPADVDETTDKVLAPTDRDTEH